MKKHTFIIAGLFASLVQSAHAVVLTFDNIPDLPWSWGGTGAMPDHEGFAFDPTLEWIDVRRFGFGSHSGYFALLSTWQPSYITRQDGGEFIFDGLWAKMYNTPIGEGDAWGPMTGFLAGYKGGELVWQIDTSLNADYRYFGAQAGTIDTLKLVMGFNFMVDDVALTPLSTVPEPSSAILGLLGASAVACAYRRRVKG